MGKKSRTKGYSGEKEVVDLFREYGFDAHREAGSVVDVQVEQIPGISVEVKRWGPRPGSWRAAMRQATAAGKGREPVVFTRQDYETWYVHVRAELLLELLRKVHLHEGDDE